MKKNDIIKIYGEDFKDNTLKLLESAELDKLIDEKIESLTRLTTPDKTDDEKISSQAGESNAERGAATDSATVNRTNVRIGIKPNLVSPTPASYGATTHPEVVAGIVEYLQARGFENISIMEGSWVGALTKDSFDVCGYTRLAEKYSVKLIDTQKEKPYAADCSGVELNLCECVRDTDFMINVPVLKGHCQTKMTCALKNMKGLIPNSEKRRFHTMGLHTPIAHLSVGVRQDFIVVDHICGDLDFEDGGNPVTVNCIMAACDPVLVDAHCCDLLDLKLEEVPYIGLARDIGSGSTDTSALNVRILGDAHASALPRTGKLVEVADAVTEVDSCSACYGTLIPVLSRLKDEGLLEGLDEKICIGQGYRGKTGRLGAGACTAKFDYSIKGCPPTEEQMYDGLIDYLSKKSSTSK